MRIARRSTVEELLTALPEEGTTGLSLEDGARIAVIGGGPAGSFFSYFFLGMAEAVDLTVKVDIYEPRHFTHSGPAGCNHCGGIISESLVQILAAEGINLPPSVVQRGIESYVVHMDEGSVRIQSPVLEQRIASVFRGNGPRGGGDMPWDSFDGYLLGMAVDRGARLERKLVSGLEWVDGLPQLQHPGEEGSSYDLVALAVGVNSNLARLVRGSEPSSATRTTRTYICEFQADQRTIRETLGSSMHVFLSDIPRLDLARGAALHARARHSDRLQLRSTHQRQGPPQTLRRQADAHRRLRRNPLVQGWDRGGVQNGEGGGRNSRLPRRLGRGLRA
jgi:2-polyprenyl-6-methoxyphenol hydroxylase-like FAD-dependent oxidoreductase